MIPKYMTLNVYFALKSVSGSATNRLASPAFGQNCPFQQYLSFLLAFRLHPRWHLASIESFCGFLHLTENRRYWFIFIPLCSDLQNSETVTVCASPALWTVGLWNVSKWWNMSSDVCECSKHQSMLHQLQRNWSTQPVAPVGQIVTKLPSSSWWLSVK